MFVQTYTVRDAADLLQGVVVTTKWVPCYGARFVVFEWKSPNANPLAVHATPLEATNLDPPTAAIAIGAASNFTAANALLQAPVPAVTIGSLSSVGGIRCVVLPLSGHSLFMVRNVRMNATGNVGATITALSCIAHVFYDETAGIPTGQVLVQ